MKTYEELAREGDVARQKVCGWGPGAWVDIKFPKPRTKAEEKAIALIEENYPLAVTVHVYGMVDFIASIIQREMDNHEH